MISQRFIRLVFSLGICAGLSVGCTSAGGGSAGTAGANGAAGTSGAAGGGAAGSAGTGATAGSGAAGTGAAGTGVAGAGAAGAGAAGTGTSGGGGAAAGAAGTPSDAAAGAGGSSTTDGGAGAGATTVDLTPMPSAGCAMTHDPKVGMTTTVNGQSTVYTKFNLTIQGKTTEYILTIPPDYKNDSTKPYPLAVAFAPRTRTEFDCMYGDCAGIETEGHATSVIVFAKQIGLGWELIGERDINLEVFKTILSQVEAAYCIDTHRIYTVGLSSGADFSMYVGCWMGDQLRSVASVSGCMPNTNAPAAGSSPQPAPMPGQENPQNICLKTLDMSGCKGHPSVFMMHGELDGVVTASNPMGRWIPYTDAMLTRDAYVAHNGCGPTTMAMNYSFPPGQFNGPIACQIYQGCSQIPVEWCHHKIVGFDGTSTHGWPGGAGKVVWDFWKSLP
jgi:hypothetical protein